MRTPGFLVVAAVWALSVHGSIDAVAAPAPRPVPRDVAPAWTIVADGGAGLTPSGDAYGSVATGIRRVLIGQLASGVSLGMKSNAMMTAVTVAAGAYLSLALGRLSVVPRLAAGYAAFYAVRTRQHELLVADRLVFVTGGRDALWTGALLIDAGLELQYPLVDRLVLRAVPLAIVAYYNDVVWGAWEPTIGIGYRW